MAAGATCNPVRSGKNATPSPPQLHILILASLCSVCWNIIISPCSSVHKSMYGVPPRQPRRIPGTSVICPIKVDPISEEMIVPMGLTDPLPLRIQPTSQPTTNHPPAQELGKSDVTGGRSAQSITLHHYSPILRDSPNPTDPIQWIKHSLPKFHSPAAELCLFE